MKQWLQHQALKLENPFDILAAIPNLHQVCLLNTAPVQSCMHLAIDSGGYLYITIIAHKCNVAECFPEKLRWCLNEQRESKMTRTVNSPNNLILRYIKLTFSDEFAFETLQCIYIQNDVRLTTAALFIV